MKSPQDLSFHLTRRQLFGRISTGIGATALASLLEPKAFAGGGLPTLPHFAPKAKRIIFLHLSGCILYSTIFIARS